MRESVTNSGATGELQTLQSAGMLSVAEQQQVLVDWNQTRRDYPRDSCIHALFEEQAKQTPEAIALVCGQEQLTYRQLNRQANQLAHHLQQLGVGPEVLVGIFVERSTDMVAGLLAILKAGGAYVPLDLANPKERLAFILAETQPVVVLTHTQLQARLPESAPCMCLDEEWTKTTEGREANPNVITRADNLAYVMYTSGSTGKPKGVEVVHRGVVRLVRGTGYATFGPDEAFLQLAPLAFDASTFEIWGPLLNGGKLVILEPPQPSLEEIGRAIRQHNVTTLWLTAGLFHLMVEERVADLKPLRQLLVGGDVLSVTHTRRAFEELTSSRLINGYGPTETTTFACCYAVGPQTSWQHSIPIGRPIANTRTFILDRHLEPVPVGVPGELYIGGDGLARGYLNDPELTAERFIDDPFSRQTGARLYKTGDRARYLPDGNIEFLGRLDLQVKIRGFRVELVEVETALRRHPGVGDCVVVVQEALPGDKRLVAYVVSAKGNAVVDRAELQQWLKEKLPGYMTPSAILQTPRLPLTPNGKVDRKALPALDSARSAYESPSVAPRTPSEKMIARIWLEVLRLNQLSVDDNFFDVGGHSLLAARVISRLRETFKAELPLAALFEHTTISSLAEYIDHALGTHAQLLAPPLVSISREPRLALSFAQERLWFLDQVTPGGYAYNVPLMFHFRGELDHSALESALGELLRRHEVLRTTFVTEGDDVFQEIAPPQPFKLITFDLSSCVGLAQAQEVERRRQEEARRPFSLAVGPLFRTNLLRLSSQEHILLVTFHHAVCDGWSLDIMVRELSLLYNSFSRGEPSPLPELTVQYADYAVWQRQWLRGEFLANQLKYWRDRLGGASPASELPTDHSRSSRQTHGATRETLLLPPELAARLREIGRTEGATLFMVLLAAFKTLLHRHTGQGDILVGSPIANRTRLEVEGLIGFFVNTLVLRTDLSGEPKFREVVRRVREVCLGAYAHQHLPFERLVEELQPERRLARNPLFQVLFVLQDDLPRNLEWNRLQVSFTETSDEAVRFDLELQVWPEEGGLRCVFIYSQDLFEVETIQRLVGHFHKLLEAIATNADESIEKLRLLTDRERQQLVVDWNKALPVPEPGSVRPPVSIAATDQSRARTEPQTIVQKKLAGLWCEVMKLQKVILEDNFFHLGGHSLQAARLFHRIFLEFEVNLPLAVIFESPTLKQLADAISHGRNVAITSDIVRIKEGRSARTLFFLPGAGGYTLNFYHLSQNLDIPLTQCGLNLPGLDGTREPCRTIEEMAEFFIGLMRKVQPAGPYFLTGYSLGGRIAYEIAFRLLRAGEKVALLAFIAQGAPDFLPESPYSLGRAMQKAQLFLKLSLRQKMEYLHYSSGRYARFKAEAESQSLVIAEHPNYQKVRKMAIRGWRRYQATNRLHTNAVVFRETLVGNPLYRREYADKTLGWARWIDGSIRVYDLDCLHGRALDLPHARTIAQNLQREILDLLKADSFT
jgi:amino acid adenylation domain-containing protein